MIVSGGPRTARGATRRSLLLGAVAGVGAMAAGCATGPAPTARPTTTRAPAPERALDRSAEVAAAQAMLAGLETSFGGRLGVVGIDTGTGAAVRHRPDEPFLMASTAKVLIVAAILRRRAEQPGLLDRLVRYDPSELLEYAPVTTRNLTAGMTVAGLCDAALTVSDNTAANLLIDILDGPGGVTAFARTLGDPVTRLDRIEPELNETAPGDRRDTTTPAAITADLRALTLGEALDPAGRDLLNGWLGANTTGGRQIRAGLPAGWQVGDKTGSGAQGEANDIAVVRPPGRPPLLISIYTAPDDPGSGTGAATIAEAASIVARALVPAP